MADNNNKPLLNYFSSEELLTAQKLNRALDILSNVDDKLKSMIDLKSDTKYVDDSINEASKNYLKLNSDGQQEVNSENNFNAFNVFKSNNVIGTTWFSGRNYYFDKNVLDDEELLKIVKSGNEIDYINYVNQSNKGTTAEGSTTPGIYENGSLWIIPTIGGSYKNTLSLIGDVVIGDGGLNNDPDVKAIYGDRKFGSIYEATVKSDNKYQTKKEVSDLIRESRFMEWDPLYSFEKGDIVTTPSYIYISLQDNNLGYVPQDNPDWWQIYQTKLDNYFTKQQIEDNYVPLSSLSKYSGGAYVNMKLNSSIEKNQLITLPFRYFYGKANLICTVGGVIQTLDLDYEEVEDSITNDGTSNQVKMLTNYDLNTTGTLEFRTLPYGKLIDSITVNDDVASKVSTYSSAKLESWKGDLVRYVMANTAMSASNWTFTRQEIFKDGEKKFTKVSDWNKIGVLNLTLNDIWPKSTEVIDVKPYRLIQIYANGAYFEGFVNDANQEQVILTSSTQSFKTYKIVFDKTKEEFFVDSDLDLSILQVLIFQARVLAKFNDANDDSGLKYSIIDDSEILIDKTWSSQKIKTSLDGVEKLVNDKAEVARQTKLDLQSQITTLKTFTADQTEAVKNLITDTNTKTTNNFNNELKPLKTVVEELRQNNADIQTDLYYAQEDIDNLKKASANYLTTNSDQNITSEKSFEGLVNLTTAKISNAPTENTSVTNKEYVDTKFSSLNTRLDGINNIKKFSFTLAPSKVRAWFANPFQKQTGFTGGTDWYMMPSYSYVSFTDWRNNFGFSDDQKTEFTKAMDNAVGAFVFPNYSNGANLWHQLESIRFSDNGNDIETIFWARNWSWANDGAIKRIEYLFVIYYLEG